MSFKLLSIPPFEKQLKRLAKKYPSLKKDISRLFDELEDHPQQGKSLGNNCYKIRLAIASKGKGKSGGARVITYVHIVKSSVYLLSIYDKSEQEDIADKELSALLSQIP
jgi:mRNA-degrading endonuclease RelE of RelBE toxin-antitoxin system